MGHEGINPAAAETLILEDGSLNEQMLEARYGLGADEASQEVTFGSWRGTVAQMLSDEKCPVGKMVEDAYKEGGIGGVTEKFQSLSQLDPKFKVEVTERTIEREKEKKN